MSAKTLDLRGLKHTEVLSVTSRAVAIMEGWKHTPAPIGGVTSAEWETPYGGYATRHPDYSTSADAVLPLLEKMGYGAECGSRCTSIAFRHLPGVDGSAATFPLAACIALLRAKGIEVIT